MDKKLFHLRNIVTSCKLCILRALCALRRVKIFHKFMNVRSSVLRSWAIDFSGNGLVLSKIQFGIDTEVLNS